MHEKSEYFVQSLSFDGVTGFHPNCPLSTVQAVVGCIELAEHQSLSVPYMLLVPFAEQSVSTNNSTAFTGVTETISPKGCSQAGIWKC